MNTDACNRGFEQGRQLNRGIVRLLKIKSEQDGVSADERYTTLIQPYDTSCRQKRCSSLPRGSRSSSRASTPLSLLLHLQVIGGSLRRRHARLQRRAHTGMHIRQSRHAARRNQTIATRLANLRDITSTAYDPWLPNDPRSARAP